MSENAYARRPDETMGIGVLPFVLIHLLALGVFFVDFAWSYVWLCVGLYYIRMFGITGGFHRYFSHRGFKTGRVFQFILAFIGATSSQKGVLWWSGHHRDHHKNSDMPADIHSPKRGFFWSHMGWFMCPRYDATPAAQLREFEAYPELMFLNKYWAVPPTLLGVGCFVLGGAPALFWGFFLSTALCWHGTFTINSLAHVWGGRRFETTDTSRNNLWLSLITLGEGWHNNHHHYQSTANNGFYWWEIDITYMILRFLSWFGIVWDLRTPPEWVLEGRTRKDAAEGLAFANLPLDVYASLAATHVAEAARVRASEVADAWSEAANDVAEAARAKAAEVSSRYAEMKMSAGERALLAREVAEQVAQAAREKAQELRTRLQERAWEAADSVVQAAEAAAQAVTPQPEANSI